MTKEDILKPYIDGFNVHKNEALFCMEAYKNQELSELQEKYNTLEKAFRELLKSYLYNAQPTHQGADFIKWIEDHRNHWEIKAGLKEQ